MLRIKQHKLIWFGIIVLGVTLLGMPAVYAEDGQSHPEWAEDEANFEEDDYDADSSAPPPVLGSTTEDFVFTPVKPCRIIDTRNAGGIIGSGGTRSFRVHGAVSGQGGNSGGCDAPRGEPRAVHINIVAVNSTANGYLTVWPYGTTRPLAGVLNYSPTAKTDPISNALTVKTAYGIVYDISVYARSQTHVVADVMGYYYDAEPEKITAVSNFVHSGSLEVGYTPVLITSKTVWLPVTGYVTLIADAVWMNSGSSAYQHCHFRDNGTVLNEWNWWAGPPGVSVYANSQSRTYTTGLRKSGSHKFDMYCESQTGKTARVQQRNMTVLFTREHL